MASSFLYKASTSSSVFYDSLADFPTTGDSNTIYIDKTTNTLYRYDASTSVYIPVGGGGDIPDPVEIVDNVTSVDTDKALSANQGKFLNDKIDDLNLPDTSGLSIIRTTPIKNYIDSGVSSNQYRKFYAVNTKEEVAIKPPAVRLSFISPPLVYFNEVYRSSNTNSFFFKLSYDLSQLMVPRWVSGYGDRTFYQFPYGQNAFVPFSKPKILFVDDPLTNRKAPRYVVKYKEFLTMLNYNLSFDGQHTFDSDDDKKLFNIKFRSSLLSFFGSSYVPGISRTKATDGGVESNIFRIIIRTIGKKMDGTPSGNPIRVLYDTNEGQGEALNDLIKNDYPVYFSSLRSLKSNIKMRANSEEFTNISSFMTSDTMIIKGNTIRNGNTLVRDTTYDEDAVEFIIYDFVIYYLSSLEPGFANSTLEFASRFLVQTPVLDESNNDTSWRRMILDKHIIPELYAILPVKKTIVCSFMVRCSDAFVEEAVSSVTAEGTVYTIVINGIRFVVGRKEQTSSQGNIPEDVIFIRAAVADVSTNIFVSGLDTSTSGSVATSAIHYNVRELPYSDPSDVNITRQYYIYVNNNDKPEYLSCLFHFNM